jgi:O-antigen ligase
MTAALLLAALAAVAFATQPLAFDLHALKRAVLLLAVVPALVTKPALLLLQRPLRGALLPLAGALFVLLVSWFAGGGRRALDSAPGWMPPLLHLDAVFELLLFLLLAVLARDVAWERGPFLLRGVALLGGALGAIALLQVLGLDPIYGAESRRVAVATFGNSNAFAAFAAPAFAVALGLACGERAVGARVAAALLAAALVVARGRGGWLAAGVGGVVALAFAVRAGRPWRGAFASAVGGTLGGVALTFALAGGDETASKPLGLGLERRSNLVRLDVARATLAVIAEKPLLGHGPGTFRDEYPRHRRAEEAAVPTRGGAPSEVDHPHDEWLRLAAEGGWPTALLVALALGLAFLAAARAPKVARDDDGRARIATLAGLAAWLASSATWSTLWDPSTAFLGALLAGVACAGEVEFTGGVKRGFVFARCFTVLVVLFAGTRAAPTLCAEFREWRAARSGTVEPEELAAIAALDSGNATRQYATGSLFLLHAREVPEAAAEPLLDDAAACFERALRLLPRHAPSLFGLAETKARRGDFKGARALLVLLRRLEPWRDEVDATLLAWGDELRRTGKTRHAVELLGRLAAATPEDAEAWRANAQALDAIDDEPGQLRATAQSQIAYALGLLREGESEAARENLVRARRAIEGLGASDDDRAAQATLTLTELLEACVDLQRNRMDAAKERLSRIGVAAADAALERATPTARRLITMLAAAPPLADEATRLRLKR